MNLHDQQKKLTWQKLHLDPILLGLLCLLCIVGLLVLYSASNQSLSIVSKQAVKFLLGFVLMVVFAQIPPERYRQWTPWIYGLGVVLLICVLLFGQWDHGARRWLGFGGMRFQPSEIMKLALPMMLSYYFDEKPLPPSVKVLSIAAIMLLVPVLLTAKQPDLGTAIIIASSGLFIVLLAGMSWRLIGGMLGVMVICTPILWHFMHAYQKLRVLIFLNPERDPLGAGYHIIQSKIAIGSGGWLGKGWLHGTQSRLDFLPTHTTDFIFSVAGEELGFIGVTLIILIFIAITARCLYISSQGQSTFARLLTGSLSLTFFLSMFINIGMVSGILPVVGVPLPLISYGGTAIVTFMAGFGIIMSDYTHKKLWGN